MSMGIGRDEIEHRVAGVKSSKFEPLGYLNGLLEYTTSESKLLPKISPVSLLLPNESFQTSLQRSVIHLELL